MNLVLRRVGTRMIFHQARYFLLHCVRNGGIPLKEMEAWILIEEHFSLLKDPNFWRINQWRWSILQKIAFSLKTGNLSAAKALIEYYDNHPSQKVFSYHEYFGWLKSFKGLNFLLRKASKDWIKPRPKRWIGVGHTDQTSRPNPRTTGLPSWETVATSALMRKHYERDEFLKTFEEKFENFGRYGPIEFVL